MPSSGLPRGEREIKRGVKVAEQAESDYDDDDEKQADKLRNWPR